MFVAVPSKGRPGKSRTLEFFGEMATAVVPSVEARAYERTHKGPVMPTSVRGITATRNWILDTVRDRHVVMIDDDVKAQGWIELFDVNGTTRGLTPNEWACEWRKLFAVTESLKLRIWGVATDGARRSVYPWRPFLWHSYVTGSMMGIVNTKRTRFDEAFPVKEDYELTLRCLKEDGAVVAARYLFWATDHWAKRGGCHDYRTTAMESKAVDRLMRKYPGLIRRVSRGGSEWSIDLDF